MDYLHGHSKTSKVLVPTANPSEIGFVGKVNSNTNSIQCRKGVKL